MMGEVVENTDEPSFGEGQVRRTIPQAAWMGRSNA